MVAGHTKFAPDQMFSVLACAYYASDIFNVKQLREVISRYADVVMDNRKIVWSWQEVVGEKYSNLPGLRDLHDFLVLCNPGHNAVTKSGRPVTPEHSETHQ